MKVLLAASEVAPIIKIGGLGDVTGSLPRALASLDIDVDVIVPFFPYAKVQGLKLLKYLELTVPFSDHSYLVTLYKTKLPGSLVDVLLVESLDFFNKVESNYFANNIKETTLFAFFSKCIVEYVKASFNTYDIIHCNDWHTGPVPGLLSEELLSDKPSVLMTIHNIMYQGSGDLDLAQDLGYVPGFYAPAYYDMLDGNINMLQEGVTSANFVNTVSPTYAQEILTSSYGGGIEEILKAKEGRLTGILNGINYSDYPKSYSASSSWKAVKNKKKKEILSRYALRSGEHGPLFSFIGRLDPGQKGIDLIYDNLDFFVSNNAALVILGKGAPDWEKKFTEISHLSEYKNNISCQMLFDINLANELYEASDFILIPSKYEPCGLVQMIGMWYGSVPVARRTGGLQDSISDNKTGLLFNDNTATSLRQALNRAVELYTNDITSYDTVVENCMKENFSWDESAKKYRDLYKKIVKLKEEESF